jgi:hypothetical protein
MATVQSYRAVENQILLSNETISQLKDFSYEEFKTKNLTYDEMICSLLKFYQDTQQKAQRQLMTHDHPTNND